MSTASVTRYAAAAIRYVDGAPNADAALCAWVEAITGLRQRQPSDVGPSVPRFRVGDIEDVVPVNVQAAWPAELEPLRNEIAVLVEDLNPVILTVADEQPASGIESEGVDYVELRGFAPGCTNAIGMMTSARLRSTASFSSPKWRSAKASWRGPSLQRAYDEMRKLALRAEEVLKSPDIDGLVFVQGTNTLEETVYFLNLTVHNDKPIVVTGAQRPFNGLSSDAQMNLLDAVRLASAPESRGKGALVAFNGEINAARDVTKTNTYYLHAFRTRDLGLLGYIDPDKIEFYRTPSRRHTVSSEFNLAGVESMPYVEIAYIHTGTRAGVANAMVGLGAKGIVIAGVGAGAPNGLGKELEDIIKKGSAVVVQSSRVGEGRIVRGNSYNDEIGMVVADNLSPQKAALLLTLGLTKTSNPAEIQRMFDEY
jgi:L-asparaginase